MGPITFGFDQALNQLKDGKRVAREGWNGKGMYLGLQLPDENSMNTLVYIYMIIPGTIGRSEGKVTPANRVPWLASQTDLLSDDWYLVVTE